MLYKKWSNITKKNLKYIQPQPNEEEQEFLYEHILQKYDNKTSKPCNCMSNRKIKVRVRVDE